MAKGRQINLDLGEGQILKGFIIDDFFACSTFLDIIFECAGKCTFEESPDYYFTYYEIDWVPMSVSESTGSNGTWHYELSACPKSLYTLISKPITNTQELARALRLDLSRQSSSLKVPCPIINQYAGNFIQDSRLYSLEQAKVKKPDDFSEAVYIYAGTKELISRTWRSIVTQKATNMEFDPLLLGSDKIMFQNDQIETAFSSAHGAKVWNQKDFLSKMIGKKFTIQTAIPASFMSVYTMKFENIPEFDSGLSYLCAYSRIDVLKTNAYVHSFANIKYMGR